MLHLYIQGDKWELTTYSKTFFSFVRSCSSFFVYGTLLLDWGIFVYFGSNFIVNTKFVNFVISILQAFTLCCEFSLITLYITDAMAFTRVFFHRIILIRIEINKNSPVVACNGSWFAQAVKAKLLVFGLYPSHAQPDPWTPTAIADNCDLKDSNEPKFWFIALFNWAEIRKNNRWSYLLMNSRTDVKEILFIFVIFGK